METAHPAAAVLMCHAPIVIPGLGGPRGEACAASTSAMQEAAEAIVRSGAESVVVLTPHLPRVRRAFGFASLPVLRGNLSAFGHPNLTCSFMPDEEALSALRKAASEAHIPLAPIPVQGIDHGATVPLWFLHEAGFRGKALVLGFPLLSLNEAYRSFGALLGEVMDGLKRPWALLASGDMSHALKPDAPSGYHPRAAAFDGAVVAAVGTGRLGDISLLDEELRELAAEDVVESLEVAAGLLGDTLEGVRLLSYEDPFGVGYLVAVLR